MQVDATLGVAEMRIYVGNLSFQTDEETLRDLFAQHGTVNDVAIISDRESGRSRGFGFVTMNDDSEAQAAIEAVNGMEFEGRTLNVNEAKPRAEGGGGRRQGGW